MKKLSAPETLKVTVYAVLLILFSGTLVAGLGQVPSKTLSPEEQELLKAQKANEEAQAEFYREQTNKLRERPAAPSPTPGRTFKQSVLDNPASVVGVVGTILGAIIVALVSLTTLYYNSRNAIRAQQDSQFYEAMKRMGDKDSPTSRASAASLLALMAQHEWRKPILSKKPPLFKVKSWKPYFDTAVDQLLTGHLLETNRVATESIKKALRQLVPLVPHNIDAITRELYAANLSFQDELAALIAEFFIVRGCQKPPNPSENQEHVDLWDQLESVTGFDTISLRKLVRYNSFFTDRFGTYRLIIDNQDSGDSGQLLSALHDKLQIASGHLRANVDLFCTALEKLQPKELPQQPSNLFSFSFDRAFLVDGHLKDANLSNIEFTRANFSWMELYNVNLANADLRWANLKSVMMSEGSLRNSYLLGANFGSAHISGVDLTDAYLGEADVSTGLKSAWWKANFGGANNERLHLLYLNNRFDPDDLNEVHASVRPFFESLRAPGRKREETRQEQNS